MTAKRTASKRKQPAAGGILLRYRDRDTAFGVTRRTAGRIARTLGLSETQVIHLALASFARQTLPRYEADNGPLTRQQMDQLRRLQPPGRMKVKESLF